MTRTETTTVSILYFDGCPNHPPAVAMTRRVVAALRPNAQVHEVRVAPEDAIRLRFLGSPTIQVDGVDIEPSARTRPDFAMSCRIYPTADGLPDESQLVAALLPDPSPRCAGPSNSHPDSFCCGAIPASSETLPESLRQGNASGLDAPTPSTGRNIARGLGPIVATLLSTACCWIPALVLAFGASAAGAAAFFETWRPAFIAVATVMLAFGFYTNYFRKPAVRSCCASKPPRARRIQRGMLWASVAMVGTMTFFPGAVAEVLSGNRHRDFGGAIAALGDQGRQRSFTVDGMSCEACAVKLRSALEEVPGVVAVEVDFRTRTGRVAFEACSSDAEQQLQRRAQEAARELGYGFAVP